MKDAAIIMETGSDHASKAIDSKDHGLEVTITR